MGWSKIYFGIHRSRSSSLHLDTFIEDNLFILKIVPKFMREIYRG